MATELTKAHGSRQTSAYVCLSITFAAATITIILRLVARRITKVSLWYDDYVSVLAYLSAAAWTGLVVWWLRSGLGLYLSEINMPVETALERSRLLLWIAEILYAFALAFAKLAILGFYWRMFKTSMLKRPIQILVVCTLLWLTLRTFLAVFHCVPVAKFWRPSLIGKCHIDDSKFFFGTVFAHLIIDLVILALPIIEIRKLQLPLKQRLGVMAMFCFGVFVCVASVVVMIFSAGLDVSIEVTWNITPIIVWATVEVNLAIVSACLPILRPIYVVVLRCSTLSGSSPHHSHPYSAAHPTSHKLTKLATHNEFDFDGTESTDKLATRVGSIASSDVDLERGPVGNVTVVRVGTMEDRVEERLTRARTATISKGTAKRSMTGRRGSSLGNIWGVGRRNDLGCIMVTSETTVRVDTIE